MSQLRALVAEELSLPVDPRVSAMAEAIAAKHAPASRAVLFYGSCLRQKQLDGLMLDFYLIVSDYRAAYGKRWLALANKLIPPNVFYFEQGGLAAKYAVLSEADFAHECGPGAWTVSTAARFAQPSRLVWSADPLSKKRDRRQRCGRWGDVAGLDPSGASGRPIRTTLESGIRHDLFARNFGRNASIARLRSWMLIPSAISGSASALQRSQRNTAGPRRAFGSRSRGGRALVAPETTQGKALFDTTASQGQRDLRRGPDYIIWKINRHAGTDFQLKPWQRRWPLLAAISLLPRLLRSGAVR